MVTQPYTLGIDYMYVLTLAALQFRKGQEISENKAFPQRPTLTCFYGFMFLTFSGDKILENLTLSTAVRTTVFCFVCLALFSI